MENPSARHGLAAALLLLAAGLCAGCSPSTVLSVLQPAIGVRSERDLPYAEGARHRLDVYAPENARGNAPVVVFLYGGSWESGDKDMYPFIGKALAARGIVTFIPDYRVYPEVRYPDFLRDNAASVRWARDHAPDYGGDPRKLVLMGHSAGAYNAAMLTLDPQWLAGAGLDADRDVAAMIGLAGPYDFLPLHDATLEKIFGTADSLETTQPVNNVAHRPPPMFLAAGRDDHTVRPRNTASLAQRVRAVGGQVEERGYAGIDHTLLVGAMADPLSLLAPVRDDVVAFIRKQTGD